MQLALHHVRSTCLQTIDNMYVVWRPDLSALGMLVARTVPYNTPMYPTGGGALQMTLDVVRFLCCVVPGDSHAHTGTSSPGLQTDSVTAPNVRSNSPVAMQAC
jgi:hypothetical protein